MRFMHSASRGIILFFVLILLQITSMLGLCALTFIKHNRQISQRMGQTMILRQQSIRLFKKIQQTLLNSSLACFIPTVSVSQLRREPWSWWPAVACDEYIGQAHYFYVIELLDKDACATLDYVNRLTVVYYRISMLSEANTMPDLHLLMQSVVAQTVNDPLICQEPLRQVTLGRQMLREITV